MDFERLSASLSELEAASRSALLQHPQPSAARDEAARAAAADERDRRRGAAAPRTGGRTVDDDPLVMARLQELDMTESLISERNAAIDDIASEMHQVADTYQRLAGMVEEQGKDLDKIEENVIDAQASTQAGVGHLTKAASYQKQYGRCLLILVIILAVIAIICGGYFGYEAEKNKKK